MSMRLLIRVIIDVWTKSFQDKIAMQQWRHAQRQQQRPDEDEDEEKAPEDKGERNWRRNRLPRDEDEPTRKSIPARVVDIVLAPARSLASLVRRVGRAA